MALIVPGGPIWANCTTSYTGTPSATPGASVTTGNTNANGATVSVLSAVTHDIEYLVIYTSGFTAATAVNRTQIDIMIDPAGGTSWASTPLIADLIVGGTPLSSTSIPIGRAFHFPLFINSGASLGVRGRTAHTANVSGRVSMVASGGNANPASWWCGQSVTAVGTTAASSSGTSHTAGNSGAFSTWASLGSTLASRAGAVVFQVQPQLSAHSALSYFFQFGAGSTAFNQPIWCATNTSEQMIIGGYGAPVFCNIPAGTQLQVRGTCSSTAEALDVAAYIVS